ncbi:MAG: NAD-dependent epimerase/dehydratase family protein [Bacteroidota bacterium]|nr:NAD-dependent epimerase/dehydratase family protein [Bacteroidota bacterium]
MKILVTGGAGFIASHVTDAYINADHSVVIIDNLSMGVKENINPKAKFYQLDIRDDKVKDIFEQEKFDIVNHHAAQMDVRKSVDDPMFDASVNVVGVLNLLENCKKFDVKKFIFASTGGAIYGEQDYFPADENHPVRPLSPYGITKLATEKYLFYYEQVFGLPYVVLRYANVYGPRQNPHGEAGVIAIFAKKMLEGGQPQINGDGKQTRDYVFVSDVVRANLLALEYGKSDIFNIGTGIETDVNLLFNEIKKLTNSNCDELHAPAKKGEQLRSVLDTRKIEEELTWEPKYKIEEGLNLTVEFFKDKLIYNESSIKHK